MRRASLLLVAVTGLIVAAVAAASSPPPPPPPPVLPHQEAIVESCSAAWEAKIRTTIQYMHAAAQTSMFEQCVDWGVNGEPGYSLSWDYPAGWFGGGDYAYGMSLSTITSDEFRYVGPYVPCQDGSEWSAVYSGKAFGTFAVGTVAQNENRLVVRCANISDTALAPDEYTYDHSFDERVWLGPRTRTQLASHDVGDTPDNNLPLYNDNSDIGPTFNYMNLAPSYNVDELAGIILHEKLHTHGFEHGDVPPNNFCGYDSYPCDGPYGERGLCRNNSLNEIAEACMSRVVEASMHSCLNVSCPGNEVPVFDGKPQVWNSQGDIYYTFDLWEPPSGSGIVQHASPYCVCR